MVRNRLFYFGSMNFQPIAHQPCPASRPCRRCPVQLGDTSTLDTTDILTGTGRLTMQLNPSNRFDIYGSKQRYDKPNRGAGTGVTQDSTSKEYDIDNTAQVLWSTVLTDRLFANSTDQLQQRPLPALPEDRACSRSPTTRPASSCATTPARRSCSGGG